MKWIGGARTETRLFLLYLLISSQCPEIRTAMSTVKQEYEVHPENIGVLYHRASSNTLLHSKAKRELEKLPNSEKVIFDGCWENGRNVLQLAKCVAAVLDARDRIEIYRPAPAIDPRCATDHTESGWLMGIFQAVRQKFLNCTQTSSDESLLPPFNQTVLSNLLPISTNNFNSSTTILPLLQSSNFTLPHSTPNVSTIEPKKPRTPLPIRRLNPIQKLIGIKKISARSKRSVADISPRCNVSTNVQTLRDLQRQFDKMNHVVRYLYNVTKSNQKFLEEVDLKIDFRHRPTGPDSPLAKAREFAEELETYDDKSVVSILSPKLLNLLKSQPDDPDSKRWLSPNMLSFSDEGMLPLPRLLQVCNQNLLQLSTSSHCETMAWLDLLMDLTGAKRMFDHIDGMFGPFMKEMEHKMYPRVQEVQKHDEKFDSLHILTSSDQQKELDAFGYVKMNREQMKIAYGPRGLIQDHGTPEFSQNIDPEQVFEEDIRELAKMSESDLMRAQAKYQQQLQDQHKRAKRQAKSLLDILLPMTNQPQVFGYRVLNPFAFQTRIRNANIMGPYIISPYAFYLQVVSPTILHMDLISPRTFIASIFSPVVMTARILAPSAFRLMLLSPLVMTLWLMVPEAFVFRVLSPKAADARIMAPEAFSMVVLGPAAGVARVLSPHAFWVIVLSPSFGTYQLFSATSVEKREFVLHTENLGIFYHRASSNALLHGKAKRELEKLPVSERVVFEQCWRLGKNVLQLAKCVAAVLDTRDQRHVNSPTQPPTDPQCTVDDTEGGWLVGVFRSMRRLWFSCDPLPISTIKEETTTTSNPSNSIWPSSFLMNEQITTAKSLVRLNSSNYTQRPPLSSVDRRSQLNNHKSIRSRLPHLRALRRDHKVVLNQKAAEIKRPIQLHRLTTRLKSSIHQITTTLPTYYQQRKTISKRSVPEVSSRCTIPTNIKSLRQLQHQFDKINHVIRYLHTVTKSNQRFLEEVDLKVDYKNRRADADSPLNQARTFAEQLESFDDKNVLSILSPKLLNLLPQEPDDPDSKRWLSPNMLSFSDEGMLPLPRLLQVCNQNLLQLSTSSHCETMAWLDLLMDLTGAKRMFDHIDGMFGPFMKEMEHKMYPRVQEVQKHDAKFDRLQSLTNLNQKQELDLFGYAKMNEQQLRIAYGIIETAPDFPPNSDADRIFEEDIRTLAKMTESDLIRLQQKYKKNEVKHRHRRQASDPLEAILPMTHQQQLFGYRVLNGFAFTTRIRNSNVLGPYILSPYAFYLQIVSPSILHADVLSPRAFIASIFSPVVLTARILAPSAFRLMLMSPLVLTFWVMVPEAFLAKIMAPKLLDARVLSPESFSFILLSPAAGVARVGSPNAMNFLVLSPSFGSYQLFSGNRHVVQVLSPGILGIDSHPLIKEDQFLNKMG
ncbi:MLt-TeN (Mlt-10) related [Aphelenchoides besseyi]|nr:MLt-TeN (Mlt-10) related [Aphelenchoides besseyi]